MDTARLMFAQAQPRDEIREVQDGDYPGLKRLLAAPVALGSNRWVIGHGTPFRTLKSFVALRGARARRHPQ